MACLVIESLCYKYGVEFVLTGGTEKHERNSLHPVGLAGDVRSRELKPEMVDMFIKELKIRLGGDEEGKKGEFQVLKESTHIHVEYQPPSELPP